jgi:hypothetical protein
MNSLSTFESNKDTLFQMCLFSVTDHQTPRDRFIQVVKWYLSAFHAGRRSPVPKKPYNPILGETFQCLYDIGLPSSNVSIISNSF